MATYEVVATNGHVMIRDLPSESLGWAWIRHEYGETTAFDVRRTRDADPAIPGSTVVATTYNCEIVLTPHGFYSRCTASGCGYVSKMTPSKAVARRWANAHDEDQPNDGRDG